EPAQTKRVRPGLRGSYEELFHDVGTGAGGATGAGDFLLRMSDAADRGLLAPLREARLQRAIGVIYRPQTERLSHYFDARIADQFDAVIHLDETNALIPLDQRPEIESAGAEEETYPSGL